MGCPILSIELFGTAIEQEAISSLSSDLLDELANHSATVVANRHNDSEGLVAPYSAEQLQQLSGLPGSRLIVARDDNGTLAGYALYHISLRHLPQWMEDIATDLEHKNRIGFAHFVVVDEKYRGDEGGYDQLLAFASNEARTWVDEFLALVRVNNPRAHLAHLKRGWRSHNIFRHVHVKEKKDIFEFFSVNLNDDTSLLEPMLTALSHSKPHKYHRVAH